jgi:hypothetical protein
MAPEVKFPNRWDEDEEGQNQEDKVEEGKPKFAKFAWGDDEEDEGEARGEYYVPPGPEEEEGEPRKGSVLGKRGRPEGGPEDSQQGAGTDDRGGKKGRTEGKRPLPPSYAEPVRGILKLPKAEEEDPEDSDTVVSFSLRNISQKR